MLEFMWYFTADKYIWSSFWCFIDIVIKLRKDCKEKTNRQVLLEQEVVNNSMLEVVIVVNKDEFTLPYHENYRWYFFSYDF